MTPKVTILLATYNRAHLIEGMLDSIKNQAYKNFECLIIDDGSTDSTAVKITSFLKDSRFRYYKRPASYNKGLPGCRNYGLDLAGGDYIFFCDDDDALHYHLLKCCLDQLINKKLDFIHFQKKSFTKKLDFLEINETLNFQEINSNLIEKVIKNEIALASCTVMWKADVIGLARFNESLHYAEEWEFYTRLLLKGAKGGRINQILYYARKHPESNTGEFYAGSEKRMKSMIKASKLIISNLNEKNLLSADLIQFFSWESVRLKSSSLFQHLLNQSSLSSQERLKIQFIYRTGPLKKSLMRLKKRFK